MATMKKCDVCGKVYEGHKSKILSSDIYSSSVSVTDYGDYSGGATFKTYEMCPSCMKYILDSIDVLMHLHKGENA